MTLTVRSQDLLSRFPPAYKQLVNLIRQNYDDNECAQELAQHKMWFRPEVPVSQQPSVEQVIISIANMLGIPEGSYEERRKELKQLGREFFGGENVVVSAPRRHHTDAAEKRTFPAEAAPALPDIEELSKRIARLPPRDRKKLEVATDETLTLERQAKKIGITAGSLTNALSGIYCQLGLRVRRGTLDVESRTKLTRDALSLLPPAVYR